MNKKELEKKVDEVLERGVLKEFLPTKKEFREKLLSGEKMKFYMGFDPTAASLHLGHAQGVLILEDFRKLGHEVIFLIGDFTGMIGDPGDKSSTRIRQTREDVENNFKNWKNQVKNIADFNDEKNPVQIKYNSEWLGKLNFEEILDLASNFTVQQMLERDMFDKRMKKGKPIHLHEFLYPLMQGYDSVVMDVDVELCGTDQIFNALAGRTLMQKLKNKDKLVIAANLIADEKTGMLMSKSNNTGVFLDLAPNDLYGAIMSQTDGMIKPLFLGCTRVPLDEIKDLNINKNPRDSKMRLAFEIVKIFHGEDEANKAQESFVNTIQNKEIPDDAEETKAEDGEGVIDFMVKAGIAESKSDARRKIEQGGVKIDGKKIEDVSLEVSKEYNNKVIQSGKKNFRKIVF
jgi:tyrosyl-tRNA synthetase